MQDKPGIWLFLILSAAFLLKMILIFLEVVPFNGDEAIVGLMSRHILVGERPVYFYGQNYMGSLDSYLVAAGFMVFGQQVWVIRLVQVVLYLVVIFIVYRIGCTAFNSTAIGLAAALFLAIPPVNATLYTTISLGGYGEALLLGGLGLLLGFELQKRLTGTQKDRLSSLILVFIWGMVCGLGIWINKLAMILVLPVGLAVFITLAKKISWRILSWGLLFLSGILLGSLPWWFHILSSTEPGVFAELPLLAPQLGILGWLKQSGLNFIYLILLGMPAVLGFRPTWEVRWLVLPVLPLVLFIWIWITASLFSKKPGKAPLSNSLVILLCVVFTMLYLFIFLPMSPDPSGRYFLPLVIPLSLIAAERIVTLEGKYKKYYWVPILLIVLYNLAGTIQCALINPPGITSHLDPYTAVDHRYDRALIDFLKKEGETRGYSNYWVAYPIDFLSEEEIILSPRLPYHIDFTYTTRDDRYPAYTRLVEESSKVVYITARHPQLDTFIREAFKQAGVAWLEEQIGDFRVYYRLSRPIRPEEIGLGQALEGQK